MSGTLLFAPPAADAASQEKRQRSITLIPRGVPRELAFSGGSIDVETVRIARGDRPDHQLDPRGIRQVETRGLIKLQGRREIR